MQTSGQNGNPISDQEFERGDIVPRIRQGTKIRMMALITFFIIVCFAKWGLGLPLPNNILVLTIVWLVAGGLYGFLVRRETRVKNIRTMYSRYFLLEMLILTFVLYFLGLGGWMGAIFYIFPIIYANTILRKKEGRIITLIAVLFYLFPVLLDYYQVVSRRRILATFDPGPYHDTPFVPITNLIVLWMFVFVGHTSAVFADMLRQKNRKLLERTKELEEIQEKLVQKERLAAMGEMAAGLAHEIRNPLAAIRNSIYFLQTVTSSKEKKKVGKHLKIIDKEIDETASIIEELLDFTREVKVELSSINVDDLIKESLKSCSIPRKIRLTKKLGKDLPRIRLDKIQMRQALNNIITNAVQAMPQGGELKIASKVDGQHLFISVSDTGEGIPKKNLEKVFQPLFTTRARGIGLGLAITKRLIEANQGKIEVESREGEGTTFYLRFPLPSG
ncbi:MAG: sensor histidine kinase [bacterium]